VKVYNKKTNYYYQQSLNQIFSFREELLRKFIFQLCYLLENQVLVPIKRQKQITNSAKSISTERFVVSQRKSS